MTHDRKSVRFDFGSDMFLPVSIDGQPKGYVKNLSHDGLFIARTDFAPGTHLEIDIPVGDGESVSAIGEVRWNARQNNQDASGIGVWLNEFLRNSRFAWMEFLFSFFETLPVIRLADSHYVQVDSKVAVSKALHKALANKAGVIVVLSSTQSPIGILEVAFVAAMTAGMKIDAHPIGTLVYHQLLQIECESRPVDLFNPQYLEEPYTLVTDKGRAVGIISRRHVIRYWQEFQLLNEEQLKANIFRQINFLVHDMQAPMTAIYAANAMLSDHVLSPKQYVAESMPTLVRENCRLIEEQLGRMLRTARCDLTQLAPVYERIDLTKYVKRCVDSLMPKAKEKNVAIMFDPASQIGFKMDRFSLQQIVMNLLDNAIRHTRPSGHVTVNIQELADGIEISVENSVSKKEPKANDYGIGLKIVEQAVKRCDAKLSFESDVNGFTAKVFFSESSSRISMG